MRAVGKILGGGGQHVRVVVGVVENVGNLLVQVGTLLAVAQCAGQGLDVLLRQADGHVIHGAGECRVRGFDARVDDLNNLLVTLLRGLVRTGHLQGGAVLQVGVHSIDTAHFRVALDDQRLEVALDEGRLDALRGLDGLQRRGRGLDRETVESLRVVEHVRDIRTGHG